jgi:hypothetical protein
VSALLRGISEEWLEHHCWIPVIGATFDWRQNHPVHQSLGTDASSALKSGAKKAAEAPLPEEDDEGL